MLQLLYFLGLVIGTSIAYMLALSHSVVELLSRWEALAFNSQLARCYRGRQGGEHVHT